MGLPEEQGMKLAIEMYAGSVCKVVLDVGVGSCGVSCWREVWGERGAYAWR
jgi:hypothetical protein